MTKRINWKDEAKYWENEFFDLLDATLKGGIKDYKPLHSKILEAIEGYRPSGKEQITIFPVESERGDRRFFCEIKNFGSR